MFGHFQKKRIPLGRQCGVQGPITADHPEVRLAPSTAKGSLGQSRDSLDINYSGDAVAFLDTLGEAHLIVQWKEVSTVFRDARSGAIGVADSRLHCDHPPAVRHQFHDVFQLMTQFRRRSNEIERSWSAPIKDFTAEFDGHI